MQSQQIPLLSRSAVGVHAQVGGAMGEKLKAPFPWFGGKSRVAELVWSRIGDVDNYVEPFAGSLAVLLGRPTPPRVETVNDLDCYLSNFWRATQHAPDEVAYWADGPVNEADLHSRHRWLVLSPHAAAFRDRMRSRPDYYDAKIAGWWCWGLCCWIGAGWCQTGEDPSAKRPFLAGDQQNKRLGMGIHAKGQLPSLRGDSEAAGQGVHRSGLTEKRPTLRGSGFGGSSIPGVHASSGGRPQLADAYARGRGIHGNDAAGTCEQRRAWLLDWFGRLRDRLRVVRVCCGDWSRVCSSDSVTTRLGTCGVFLDPPYSEGSGRDMGLYSTDSGSVAHEVRDWCLEWGPKKGMRIALCGYEGEHEALEAAGWKVEAWAASGGYGNRTEQGKANAAKERIWFSPQCLHEKTLFG